VANQQNEKTMKNLTALLAPVICIFLLSCGDKSDPKPDDCTTRKLPLPSFTQDKYQVHVGESVTFTYNGPDQDAETTIKWTSWIGEQTWDIEEGNTHTVLYEHPGSYAETVQVYRYACGQYGDRPFYTKNPAVVVVP
jgi:hypothetical protein